MMDSARERRLGRNEIIRRRNRERAAANELRPRRLLTTVVMNGCQPDTRTYCPACEASITTTDLEAGYCTNCNAPLSDDEKPERESQVEYSSYVKDETYELNRADLEDDE